MSKMEVDLALNSRKFQAGVKDAERELESFSDVLEDLVDTSGDLERDGTRAFDDTADAAKDAEREVKDLTDEVKDLEDEFRDAARKADDLGDAGKDAGRKAKSGMDDASEGVKEFKDEAASTAREAAASFDGSAQSVGDAFQEVAANAFAGFGPAGAVAGIAAAAGIGLAVAGFEAMGEASEASKERAAEWAQSYIDAGSTILDNQTRIAKAQEIITDPERYQTMMDNAREWGVTEQVALQAMTGDTVALEEVRVSLTAREAEAQAQTEANTDAYGNLSLVQQGANQEVRNGRQAYDELTGEMARGSEAARLHSQYLIDLAHNTEGATWTTDEFGDHVAALPDGTTVYIDAETGQATSDVSAIERRIYGIPDGHANINVSTSGADAALIRWQNQRRTVTVTANVIARNGMPLAV